MASRARAMMAAAMGAEADVPVCFIVHPWCRSVVTICRSDDVPELKEKEKLHLTGKNGDTILGQAFIEVKRQAVE